MHAYLRTAYSSSANSKIWILKVDMIYSFIQFVCKFSFKGSVWSLVNALMCRKQTSTLRCCIIRVHNEWKPTKPICSHWPAVTWPMLAKRLLTTLDFSGVFINKACYMLTSTCYGSEGIIKIDALSVVQNLWLIDAVLQEWTPSIFTMLHPCSAVLHHNGK